MHNLKRLALVAAALLLAGRWALAQDQLAGFVGGVNSLLPKLQSDIDALFRDAWTLAALVVLVAVSGFVAGLVKGTDSRRYRISVAAGITTVLLTTVTSTFYDVDHRTLFNHVNEARRLYRSIVADLALRDHLDTVADRETWKDSIRQRVDRINELTGVAVFSVPLFGWQGVVPEAYAESGPEPAWVREPPRSRVDLFFVGQGAGRSIEAARAAAERDAVAKAQAFLATLWPGGAAPPAVLQEIVGSLKIEDTHLATDPGGGYRFLVLGRIGRKVLEGRIWLAPAPIDEQSRREFANSVQQAEQSAVK